MNQYLLFSGTHDYASGGWGDFVKSSNSIEELKNPTEEWMHNEWAQIIDLNTKKMIFYGQPSFPKASEWQWRSLD